MGYFATPGFLERYIEIPRNQCGSNCSDFMRFPVGCTAQIHGGGDKEPHDWQNRRRKTEINGEVVPSERHNRSKRRRALTCPKA